MAEFNEAVTPEEFKNKIDAKKSGIKKKHDSCKTAAKKLVTAHDKFVEEGEKENKKPSKYATLEDRLNLAKEEFLSLLAQYDAHVAQTKELYASYIKILGAKPAKKVSAEAAKFEKNQSLLRENLILSVSAIMPAELLVEKVSEKTEETVEEPVVETPVKEESKTQIPPQNQYNPYFPPQSVNIAPMSIDISGIVEDAVAAAMNKFKETFEKQASSITPIIPTGGVTGVSEASVEAVQGADRILQLETKLLEDEQAIIEKLTALAANINTLTTEVTNLGAAYIELSNKHKDAVEAQRNVNDLQRTIAREIQGVQANQKVINQEQAALAGEQAVIIEQQKLNIEQQKHIGEAQAELTEIQKTVVSTQATLEESMKEVLASQKEIIATQQSVISENVKTLDVSRELSGKQTDVIALQKDVLLHQKEVARAQKNINAKIEAKKEKPQQ